MNLANRQQIANQLTPIFLNFKNELDKVLVFWKKCDYKKKKLIVQRDPIMGIAFQLYKYLNNFFGDIGYDS